MRIRQYLAGWIFFWALASWVHAQNLPYQIAPAPNWVEAVAVPTATQPATALGGSVRFLLNDEQTQVGRDKAAFNHYALQALNPAGVQQLASIQVSFMPDYQQLVWHRIDILRDGKRLKRLDPASIRILSDERQRDQGIYDGMKAAVVELKDIRIGDVLEYSYSLRGSNPVFANRLSTYFSTGWSLPVDQASWRLLSDRPLHYLLHNETQPPQQRLLANGKQYEWRWQGRNLPGLADEPGRPSWVDPYPGVQFSEYDDWQAVAAWASELFDQPAKLPKELMSKVQGWRRNLPVDEQVLSALRFVQEDIRYLSLSLNMNSHKPHAPAETLRNRYGDCKDKSLLLVSLLEEMGFHAVPVLVSTSMGPSLNNYLPSPSAFDHVIVRVEMPSAKIWLDPTRTYQRGGLQDLGYESFGWALLVQPQTRELVKMPDVDSQTPTVRVEETYSILEYGGEVLLDVESEFSRNQAEFLRYRLATTPRPQLEQDYLNFYSTLYTGISAIQPIEIEDDPKHNRVRVREHYRIPEFAKVTDGTMHFPFSFRDIHSLVQMPAQSRRTTPLLLGTPKRVQQRINLHFPDYLRADVEEAPLEIDSGGLHLRREAEYIGMTLSYLLDLQVKQAAIPASAVSEHANAVKAIQEQAYFSYDIGLKPDYRPSTKLVPILDRLEPALLRGRDSGHSLPTSIGGGRP